MSIKPQMMSGQLRWSQIPSFKWNKERVEKALSALCLIFKSSMGHVYFVGGGGIVQASPLHWAGLHLSFAHSRPNTAAPALALTALWLRLEAPPSSCRRWARAASVTSEQEGRGKERKAREKPDTPSFPTPPAAVPTPQPRFPKPLMLLFICSRNQSWVVPWGWRFTRANSNFYYRQWCLEKTCC